MTLFLPKEFDTVASGLEYWDSSNLEAHTDQVPTGPQTPWPRTEPSRFRGSRCPACRMRPDDCLCNDIKPLVTRTRLDLVLQKSELRRPSNTGQLAAQLLSPARVQVRGLLEQPFLAKSLIDPERTLLLLYPGKGHEVLTPEYVSSLSRPITLIVPDGNWRQAGRLARKIHHETGAQIVSIPPGPVTQYQLRKETKIDGLSTLEAIAEAYAALEGPEVRTHLLRVFRLLVERNLKYKRR